MCHEGLHELERCRDRDCIRRLGLGAVFAQGGGGGGSPLAADVSHSRVQSMLALKDVQDAVQTLLHIRGHACRLKEGK